MRSSKAANRTEAIPAEIGRHPSRGVSLVNAMTIDVEDYFQVEAFAQTISRDQWETLPRRVAQNTNRLLDILAEERGKATFFTLGWVAERHPELVRRIVGEGHELASHGSDHYRAHNQSLDEFRGDVRRSKALLEDITGSVVRGYRAPTFSAGRRAPWVHEILAEEGFRYSSSIYPIAHDLYGEPLAPRQPFRPLPSLIEIPMTTVRVLGRNWPSSGGGYFRLLPYGLTRWALRRARRELSVPSIFYVHPWEIDPDQPRQTEAPALSRFRHYLNLSRTEERLRRLLKDFKWTRMDEAFSIEKMPSPPLLKTWLPPSPR